MDKENISTISNYNHGVSLLERKNLVITGVKKIDNFDSEQFLVETVLGFVKVIGNDLELIKLDTMQGTVSIKGVIDGFNYIEDTLKKDKENSIFNRLFK